MHSHWPPSCPVVSRLTYSPNVVRGERMMMKNTHLAGLIFTCVLLSGMRSRRWRSQKDKSPTASAKWKTAWMNSGSGREQGDQRKEEAQAGQGSGRTGGKRQPSRRKKRRRKTDELDDALGDLNRSTNRLRRKFDPTDRWMETRAQVENVLDDARRSTRRWRAASR